MHGINLIEINLAMHRIKADAKGLKLELEPTTGNHNQEFLDMWYSNPQEFSLILMKEIVVL